MSLRGGVGTPVWTGGRFRLWVSGVGDAEGVTVPLNLRLSFCTTGPTGFISQGSGRHVLTSVECVLFIHLPCCPPNTYHIRLSESETVSHSVVSNSLQPPWTEARQTPCPWDSPDKNTGVGCHGLLQGIFPTQGSNPGLPHCRWILYRLSHQRSPDNKHPHPFLSPSHTLPPSVLFQESGPEVSGWALSGKVCFELSSDLEGPQGLPCLAGAGALAQSP